MINPIKIITAGLLVAGLAIAPASAASWQFQQAQVQNAQFNFSMGNGYDDRSDGRFERRGNYYYYNGERGSRERRAGWRNYNGYWFPQSAFSFSFRVNGDRDRGRGRGEMRISRAHVEWCEDRYRSYRVSDNSFQPYHGPRQECLSPYSG
jgi:hypothetical protein